MGSEYILSHLQSSGSLMSDLRNVYCTEFACRLGITQKGPLIQKLLLAVVHPIREMLYMDYLVFFS